MFIHVTPETAPNILFGNYRYEQIPGNRFRATAINIDDGVDNLRLIFPTSVPLDEDGRPFTPGCDCAELQPCHQIYTELQLRARHVIDLSLHSGIFRRNENDEPEFEFLAPDAGADDAIITITWDGKYAPPMKGLTCSFARKFRAKYFARVEPEKDELSAELETFGIDLWIIPKNGILAEAFRDATKEIREQIAAGDVFAATQELVRPVYRDYMQTVIYPAILATGSDYMVEFGDDQADLFLVMKETDENGKTMVCGRTQVGRFKYTLKDAQRLAAYASHRVTTTRPNPPTQKKCRIANPDPPKGAPTDANTDSLEVAPASDMPTEPPAD